MIGRRVKIRAPAARAAREHVRVVEQPVQQRRHGHGVAKELAPVVHRTIRREDGLGPFTPAHDELEQIFGVGRWQVSHAEIVEDQEQDGAERREDCLAHAIERGVRQLFQPLCQARRPARDSYSW